MSKSKRQMIRAGVFAALVSGLSPVSSFARIENPAPSDRTAGDRAMIQPASSVHRLLLQVEELIALGKLTKQPLAPRGRELRSSGLLAVDDSRAFLTALVDTLEDATNETPLLGFEERLIDIGIDDRAADGPFLSGLTKRPGLRDGIRLVHFLSTLEFVVKHANHFAGDDDRDIDAWVANLIRPVAKEFAGAVTRSGFFLPKRQARLGTRIESTSEMLSNLGGAYKVLLGRSKAGLAEAQQLKAIVNLSTFHAFNAVYALAMSDASITIATLPAALGLDAAAIERSVASRQRATVDLDFATEKNGPEMKSEILKGAVQDLIRNRQIGITSDEAEKI